MLLTFLIFNNIYSNTRIHSYNESTDFLFHVTNLIYSFTENNEKVSDHMNHTCEFFIMKNYFGFIERGGSREEFGRKDFLEDN